MIRITSFFYRRVFPQAGVMSTYMFLLQASSPQAGVVAPQAGVELASSPQSGVGERITFAMLARKKFPSTRRFWRKFTLEIDF